MSIGNETTATPDRRRELLISALVWLVPFALVVATLDDPGPTWDEPFYIGASHSYVGWFGGVNTLSEEPVSTGRLRVQGDGRVEAQLETGWVAGPRIEYFYTLGLAYFYMAECEQSYPLFEAALEIEPEEVNALEGIRLCQEAEE